MQNEQFRTGIDIGSTTAKLVILNQNDEIIFSDYRRHNAETVLTLQVMIHEGIKALGDIKVNLLITGSAGMGISEKFDIPFIQEVVASAEVVRQFYPEVKTLIDIGGEDAKMIIFNANGTPDIRMNGSCAGGTGAFIDQMAVLLNVPVSKLNELAENHTIIYPIASRCGVFAKTDIQNLLSREIAKEDIAASVFNAVVLQTIATLSRGNLPSPQILFSGGPLTFLPALKKAFVSVLKVDKASVHEVDNSELLTAIGAALANSANRQEIGLVQLKELLKTPPKHTDLDLNRLVPLFEDKSGFKQWEKTLIQNQVERIDHKQLNGAKCFLGVDSGSTTTKLVMIDEQGRIAFDYYCNNNGNPINAVREGLKKIQRLFESNENSPNIVRSMVTGYGEDLIRTAFDFDEGMVETLAHFQAAKSFESDVSFILDIGGQDMKAIFVENGHIQNIEINEACSSGCGTFIESFAQSLGYSVSDFAQSACKSDSPCDLGTRCTVFMNSKVKQSLREGAKVGDISAGLAYSVIKNVLHKVLKVTDTSVLGEKIIVQGGTFLNPAIQKALENLLGKQVICPDIAELMGAFGAALSARDTHNRIGQNRSHFMGFENLANVGTYTKKQIRCGGCENKCKVTKLEFQNNNVFYTGNRCEKIYTNSGKRERLGTNLPDLKYNLLFDRETEPVSTPVLTMGIPRALNLYENFPFWNTLFVESGIRVQLSARSSNALCNKGAGTIMSENICFPAKLAHGHIYELIEAGVDRIFFPMVFYQKSEFIDSDNCYNCPVVSGYPDVIRSAIDPEGKFGIPLDSPAINFNDRGLLKKACYQYLAGLGIKKKTFKCAFDQAIKTQQRFKEEVQEIGIDILNKARADGRPVVLLMGRPYQYDPLVNHKVPDVLVNFGIDVITEDAVPIEPDQTLDTKQILTQWEYSNRLYHAAHWAKQQDDVEIVLLNSFGCGPDSSVLDEIGSILGEFGKKHTVIRIDEIESIGSTKLRLRSMIELINRKEKPVDQRYMPRKNVKVYQESDRQKTIIVPQFSRFISPAFSRSLIDFGYKVDTLAPPNNESVQVGLKYTNNEICYPAIIVIGDVIKALKSGKYDPSDVVIGWWETGGQCRASNYRTLLKRALISSGFEQVPVITVSTSGRSRNEQPGFKLDNTKFLVKTLFNIIYTDTLANMYYATAIREKNKGETLQLADNYLHSFENGTTPLNKNAILDLLREAVVDFNAISTYDRSYPKVGIVGEIFVKYNPFSMNYIADWLMDQEIEVVIPPLTEFFLYSFISRPERVKANITKPSILMHLITWGDKYVQAYLDDVDDILKGFRYYQPIHSIRSIAEQAQKVLSLTHKYGEGWLIAGGIGTLVKAGVQDVLCLQPFGCIANHVVAKGVGTRLKGIHPQLNLLYLDLDAGASEVNLFNRLHFFINHVKTSQNKIQRVEELPLLESVE